MLVIADRFDAQHFTRTLVSNGMSEWFCTAPPDGSLKTCVPRWLSVHSVNRPAGVWSVGWVEGCADGGVETAAGVSGAVDVEATVDELFGGAVGGRFVEFEPPELDEMRAATTTPTAPINATMTGIRGLTP